MTGDANKSINDAILDIARTFGTNSVLRLGRDHAETIDAIPTGSSALDEALGIGGLPRGKQTEIFGVEAAGKTTLALHVVANAQAEGLLAAYIDAEHALDVRYAEAIGVDMDELLFCQPSNGEEALEIALRLIQSGGLGVLVVDSIAALATRAEIAGEIGEAHIGGRARLVGQALRKIAPAADETNTCCVYINQLREKVGVIFGSPETVPGGKAMKYAAAVRIDLRRKEIVKRDGDAREIKVKARVVKNKCAAPYKEAEYRIVFGQGIKDKGQR